MKVLAVLVAVLAVASALSTLPNHRHNKKRLLAFSDTDHRWVPEHKIEQMRINNTFFIDITDYPNFKLDQASVDRAFPTEPHYEVEVKQLISKININRVTQDVTHLSENYDNRKYTTQPGRESALWIESQFKAIAGSRSDITVELFEHTFGVQPSVIAKIEGTGSLASQHLIIGGHEDSTASGNIAPGADDDGSGSATVLEAFRLFVDATAGSGQANRRTLEFHTYAAEEAGLRGSGAIALDYQSRMVDVYAMLQFDMTGYRNPNNAFMSPITDYTSPSLTAFMRLMISTYCDAPQKDSRCGYGCSDHASFHGRGYPAVFTFEAPFGSHNPAIHTSNDRVDRMTWSWALEFVKLGVGAMYELMLAP